LELKPKNDQPRTPVSRATGTKKKAKKKLKIFGRKKRVITFAAPKERETSYGREKRG